MAQIGRPRTFDRQQAIEQAMLLFWQNGYESTSLSQLKAAIGGGISAPSFYAAFGSKEALFQEAVQCYLDSHAQVTECLWDSELPARSAVELALRRSARMQFSADHPAGCMVSLGVMSAPTAENNRVTRQLSASRARTGAGFVACVERAVAAGELPAGTSVQGVAMVFNSFLQGLSIQARDGQRLAVCEQAIDDIMRVWDSLAVQQ